MEAEIDHEVVLMELANGNFFALGGTARSIWEMIDGSRSPDDIVNELAKRHDMQPEQIEDEVMEFLGHLQSRGFIEDIALQNEA